MAKEMKEPNVAVQDFESENDLNKIPEGTPVKKKGATKSSNVAVQDFESENNLKKIPEGTPVKKKGATKSSNVAVQDFESENNLKKIPEGTPVKKKGATKSFVKKLIGALPFLRKENDSSKSDNQEAHQYPIKCPSVTELYRNREVLIDIQAKLRMILRDWNTLVQDSTGPKTSSNGSNSFSNDLQLFQDVIDGILDRWDDLAPVAKAAYNNWPFVRSSFLFLERNYSTYYPVVKFFFEHPHLKENCLGVMMTNISSRFSGRTGGSNMSRISGLTIEQPFAFRCYLNNLAADKEAWYLLLGLMPFAFRCYLNNLADDEEADDEETDDEEADDN